MKSQKYTISVGSQNMVGRVADRGESKIANNVLAEPLYQPNPLLLDTQSEAAIPLHVGERTVGVIDIQSKDLNAFSQDTQRSPCDTGAPQLPHRDGAGSSKLNCSCSSFVERSSCGK